MRVFRIDDGKFTEFVRTEFSLEHEEAVLEEWLEANPDGIVDGERLLLIGRQVTTNLRGFVDLMGIDRDGDVVVVELKRGRTPRDTLAQALEYASFAERLDGVQLEAVLRKYLSDESVALAEYHRDYFGLDGDVVSFNKDQRIVIVGQQITPEIRQTARYLSGRGQQVTCVEFTFFETEKGQKLLSHQVIVGQEARKPAGVMSASLPVVSEDAFLDSTDNFGRPVFEQLLGFARKEGLPIHWGSKGFSMNVDFDGVHVAVCYGYPPTALYGQVITSALAGRGNMVKKIGLHKETTEQLLHQAKATGLFVPAGGDVKCLIDRSFESGEISQIIQWLGHTVEAVREKGLSNPSD